MPNQLMQKQCYMLVQMVFRNVREPVSDPFGLETHESSCHAGAPVVRGAKHIATRWVHPVPYPDGLS